MLINDIAELEQQVNAIQPNYAPLLMNPEDYDKFIPCVCIPDNNGLPIIYAPNTNPDLTFLQNAATIFEDIDENTVSVDFIFSKNMNPDITSVLFRNLNNPTPDVLNGAWIAPNTLRVNFPIAGLNVLAVDNMFQFDLSDLQDFNLKSIVNVDWKQTFRIIFTSSIIELNQVPVRVISDIAYYDQKMYILDATAQFILVVDSDNNLIDTLTINKNTLSPTSLYVVNNYFYIIEYSRSIVPSENNKMIRKVSVDRSNPTDSYLNSPTANSEYSYFLNGKFYILSINGKSVVILDTETDTFSSVSISGYGGNVLSMFNYEEKFYIILDNEIMLCMDSNTLDIRIITIPSLAFVYADTFSSHYFGIDGGQIFMNLNTRTNFQYPAQYLAKYYLKFPTFPNS
jgi:hypothetical protein